MSNKTKFPVILVCGIPGSGKSVEVDKIVAQFGGANHVVVCTVNDFFQEAGVFRYVHLALGYAQDEARTKFNEAIADDIEDIRAIIVEDIFSTVNDLRYYIFLAQAYGCEIELVTMECDPATAIQRQVHGMFPGYIVCRDRDLRARVIPKEWNVKQRTVQTSPIGYPVPIH